MEYKMDYSLGLMSSTAYPSSSTYPNFSYLDPITTLKKKESVNMKNNCEYLYEVFMVSETREVLIGGELVVACNDEEAKMEAGVYKLLEKNGLRLKQASIIVRNLGNVLIKEDK